MASIPEIESNMLRKCECDCSVDMIMWDIDDVYLNEKGARLDDLMTSDPQDTPWPFDPDSKVVLIIAKANDIRKCTFCRESLTKGLRMPRFWWSDTYKRMNGYFGSESTRNSEEVIDSCSTWSRALVKHFVTSSSSEAKSDIDYYWLKFNIFTRWYMPDKIAIIAFDPVKEIEQWLCSGFIQNLGQENLRDPFWPYTRILDELVSLLGTSVWTLRNLIRTTELSPSRDHRNVRNKPKHNYSRLHDIARHAIHVSETLDLSVKLTESILREHKQLATSISSNDLGISVEKSPIFKQAYYNTRSHLAFFSNALSNLRCRSTSNNQRLNNEIQLRFHTDSQYDSQASIEINYSTKSDSASMRWIAIVSLVFLPANLVSSIFSTTFFNGSDGVLSVSSDFWIYWVVLVVVTIATMIFWFYLPRISPEADSRRDNSAGEKEAKGSLRNLIRGTHIGSFGESSTFHV